MPDGPTIPECFDPYLRYAISTDFKNFAFAGDGFWLFLLAELMNPRDAGKFEEEMSKFRVEFGPDLSETGYITLRGTRAMVEPDAWPTWKKHVSRVELSLPLTPSSTEPFTRKGLVPRYANQPPAQLLIGMMDDGCPFAAAQFLKVAANSPTTTVASNRSRSMDNFSE